MRSKSETAICAMTKKIAQVPAMNAATAGGDGAFAQTLGQIPARRLQCRGESENDPAQKREQHGEIITRKSGCGSSESGTGVAGNSEIKTSPSQ